MKHLKLILLFLIVLSSCHSQDKKDIQNEKTTGFILDSVYFFHQKNNDFPKNAIAINNGYIITGQKHLKTDSVNHKSALIKISPDGTLLKQRFYGNSHTSGYATNETIFKTNNGKILQFGEKEKKLWLREIDSNLNTIKDTVLGIGVNALYQPRVAIKDNEFIVISNKSYKSESLFNLSYISNDLKQIEHEAVKSIKNTSYIDYIVKDIAYDSTKDNLYILGGGCLEKNEKGFCKNFEWSILVYNAKRFKKKITLTKGTEFKTIEIYNNTIYVAGRLSKKLEKPIKHGGYEITKDIDYFVASYNQEGKKLLDFSYNENESDYIKDMLVSNNKIYLVGEMFNRENSKFLATYFSFDLKGKLIERRIFSYKHYLENRITRIIKLNNKILILGKSGSWRIMINED